MNNPCYITRYECVSPLGLTHQELSHNIKNGNLCVSSLPQNFLPEIVPVKFIGAIPNQILSIEHAFSFNEAMQKQRNSWLDLIFTKINEEDTQPFSSILFVHNMVPGVSNYYHWLESEKKSVKGDNPLLPISQTDFITRIQKNGKTQVISLHSTCASVASAVAYAAKRIRAGIDHKIMVVAFELSNSHWPGFVTLSALGVLNTSALKKEDAIQPFSSKRAGFVKADALGFLVLESEKNLSVSKQTPLCEVAGQGMTADSNSLTDGVEDGSIVAKTMLNAMSDAKIHPEQIDYINAHGTGTFLNDLIEVRAVKRLFGEKAMSVPMSSTKSQYGHALCASGLVEISAILEMFKGRFIGASLNCDRLDAECNLNFVAKPLLNTKINFAIKNSFGFGGYNASLVLKNCL